MMNYEDIDPCAVRPCGSPAYGQLSVAAMTWEQAATAAKAVLCASYAPWCERSLQEVASRVCGGTDMFNSTNCDDVCIRRGLDCELASQSAVYCAACPTNGGNGNGNGGTADNTMMMVALAGLAVIGVTAVVIATRQKKVVIARVA